MKKAPNFNAQAGLDGKVQSFSLAEALSKGPVVVYFYPAAFTPGCNIQAHDFSQKMAQFDELGATVVGVSLDGIDKLLEYSKDPQFCAGKVLVAEDPDGDIAKSYGLEPKAGPDGFKDTRGDVVGHAFVDRTTFVIDEQGEITLTITDVSPSEHVNEALKHVKLLTTTDK